MKEKTKKSLTVTGLVLGGVAAGTFLGPKIKKALSKVKAKLSGGIRSGQARTYRR